MRHPVIGASADEQRNYSFGGRDDSITRAIDPKKQHNNTSADG